MIWPAWMRAIGQPVTASSITSAVMVSAATMLRPVAAMMALMSARVPGSQRPWAASSVR